MYIDSHAHLDSREFQADLGEVLARGREAGVERILAIASGAAPGTLGSAALLAGRHDWIYASVGIDPHQARLATEHTFQTLEALAENPRVIAWGEIGLDYYYDLSPRDVQKKVFQRQLELARAARLPVIVHCRPTQGTDNAWQDALQMLDDYWASSGLGGILHCFTGEWRHAAIALRMGLFISFAGNLTYPKAEGIRSAAARVPPDRLLIETDCPYLPPVPHRGRRNEPAYVVNTAEALGRLHGLAKDDLARQTAANFYTLFPQTR